MLLEKFGWSDAKVDEALPRFWRMGELVIPRKQGSCGVRRPGRQPSSGMCVVCERHVRSFWGSRFSFPLLATDSASHMPSPAVVSAAASAETWDRTDPFSSCRSRARLAKFESRVVKLCTGNPSAVWCVSFLTCADSELVRAEPDRVVDALEEVPRPQTAEAPTRAADATRRSRSTRIRKYEPALAPR